MKKLINFLVFSLVFVLFLGFTYSLSYADVYNVETAYITSSRCDIDIDNNGELVVDAICRARDGKTIYGEITIQRRGWFGWFEIESFDEIGYNGKLYVEEFFSLNRTGKYRAKFTVTCVNESYTVYSTEEDYWHL